ncbi:unnamed protein product [Ectocarpus sp. CCAP 1310/34]|nr:unnamed protein product [Ectocarpus sp. CCAP 1310/34]
MPFKRYKRQELIPDFAAVTAPMVDLTKKDVVKSVATRWGPKHDEELAEVKRLLTNLLFCFFRTSLKS